MLIHINLTLNQKSNGYMLKLPNFIQVYLGVLCVRFVEKQTSPSTSSISINIYQIKHFNHTSIKQQHLSQKY